jgi:hypothetical protein
VRAENAGEVRSKLFAIAVEGEHPGSLIYLDQQLIREEQRYEGPGTSTFTISVSTTLPPRDGATERANAIAATGVTDVEVPFHLPTDDASAARPAWYQEREPLAPEDEIDWEGIDEDDDDDPEA